MEGHAEIILRENEQGRIQGVDGQASKDVGLPALPAHEAEKDEQA